MGLFNNYFYESTTTESLQSLDNLTELADDDIGLQQSNNDNDRYNIGYNDGYQDGYNHGSRFSYYTSGLMSFCVVVYALMKY